MLSYTQRQTALVLHAIPVGTRGRLEVVTDLVGQRYEWVVYEGGVLARHSDAGYNRPELALRDGLISCCGLPQ